MPHAIRFDEFKISDIILQKSICNWIKGSNKIIICNPIIIYNFIIIINNNDKNINRY